MPPSEKSRLPSRKRAKSEAAWKEIRAGSVQIKIYKVANGYRSCWYEAGERKQKFATKADDAVSFAKATAAALASGTDSTLPHSERDLAYFRQLQASMGDVPLHRAVDFWKQNHRTQTIVDARLDELFRAFTTSLEENQKSPSYRAAIQGYLTPFVKTFPGIIRDISSTQIDSWMTQKTKSLHSRKHFLQSCVTLFRWARDVKKALPATLKTEPELIAIPTPKAKPIEIYTPAEMKLFLKYARDEEIALVVLGGFCGLRTSEITGDRTAHGALRCEDLLFGEKSVHVIQKMQHETVDRYAPLTDRAAHHLRHLKGKTGPVWDTTTTPFHVYKRLLLRIRKEGHEIRQLRNGFRRSYISYRTSITRDVAKVADECNTSPEKIRKNYRRPGLESVAHAWFKL